MSNKEEFVPAKIDSHLRFLVFCANKFSVESSVTLTVSGTKISGRIVSGKKYFETFSESYRTALNGTYEEAFEKHFSHIIKYYSEDNIVEEQVSYIHLADARYISTDGHQAPVEGMLWRGKLESVNGFSLGCMTALA